MAHRTYHRAAIIAAVLAPFRAASAHSEPSDGLEMASSAGEDSELVDIIVTARKQAESLISVPVAVSAIGQAELERRGAKDLNQISQLAPQLVVAKAEGGGSGASFSIRGIGNSGVEAGVEQSVAIVIDGLQISRGHFINQGLFDLSQVEVLKGPQALFFGKNSPAGVVSLQTAGPTEQLSGFLRAGYEFDAREVYVEGAISGPLSETLKARVAVRGTTMRGWMTNVALPLSGSRNPYFPNGSPGRSRKYAPGAKEVLGRVTLVWTPSSDFDATLKVSGGAYRDHGSTTEAYCFDGTAPGALALLDPFKTCDFTDELASVGVDPALIVDWPYSKSDGDTYLKQRSLLTSLTMNYRAGDIEITSVTGYLKLKLNQFNNYEYTSFGAIPGGVMENTRSFSQEVRIATDFGGALNVKLGAYYERIHRDNGVNALIFFGGPDPATGRFHSFNQTADNRARTVSLFGQVNWDIVETLTFSSGLRYTKEKKRTTVLHDYVHALIGPLVNLVPAGRPYRDRISDANYSPEITLSWKAARGMLAYAAYKTGYKSGGYSNPALFQLTTVGGLPDLSFAPEKVKGFEGGAKGYLFGKSLRIEAEIYRYKYSNLQLSIFNPDTFSNTVRNAADARIQGASLQTEWIVVPGLRFKGDVAYNRARFLNFATAPCFVAQPVSPTPAAGFCTNNAQDLSGRKLVRAPEWTLGGALFYDTSLTSSWKIGLDAALRYTGSYITAEDHDPRAVQDGFALLDAGVRIYSDDDRYELALIGKNLSDKNYVQASISKAFGKPSGDFQAAFPRARQVSVQGTYRF